ncbi:MAG TPA: hypothetical protein VK112_12680 [Fodinibius sp.]|nr:hypothetical protein [Fodinibius sp.]
MALSKEILSNKVGTWIFSHRGELLGTMERLLTGRDSDSPGYVILKRTPPGGSGRNRYYAISAHPSQMGFNHRGSLILNIDKDVLPKVLGVMAPAVPAFVPDYPTVFELYLYEELAAPATQDPENNP